MISASGCEGAYVPASTRRAVVDGWYTATKRAGPPADAGLNTTGPPQLYAVTRRDDGTRGVVFAFENGVGAFALVHPDGGVDLLANVCENYPANLLVANPSGPMPELLLAPLAPAPLE